LRIAGSALLAWIAVLAGAAGSPTQARTSDGAAAADMQALVREAELVFRGSVRSVEHRLSEPVEPGTAGTPFTFVTYDIAEVLKGAVDGAQLTLRFIGGPLDGDRFLMLPGNPLFDVGDSDLLLVRGNGSEPCPLVRCSDGRFRLIDEFVVNELGQRMQLGSGGSLSAGPRLKLAELAAHDVSGSIHLTLVESAPQGAGEAPTPEAVRASGGRDPERDPTPARFSDFVARAITRAHTFEELAAARERPVASANPRLPFRVAPFVPVPAEPPAGSPGQRAILAQPAAPAVASSAAPPAIGARSSPDQPAQRDGESGLAAAVTLGGVVMLLAGALSLLGLSGIRRGSPDARKRR
jgi:hypothetical protein